jgi:hypothetical protein
MMEVDQKLALALNKELNRPKVRLINNRQGIFAGSETGQALGGFRNSILDEIERLEGDVARYEQEQENKQSDYGLRSNTPSQVNHSARAFYETVQCYISV